MDKIKLVGNKIYWSVDEYKLTTDFPKHQVLLAAEQSVGLWQKLFIDHHIGIEFVATNNLEAAAMPIHFRQDGDPDLPRPFGNGVLGFAFFPPNSSIWLNDAFDFSAQDLPGFIYLKKLMVHEIGHSLGFGHYDTGILESHYEPEVEIIFGDELIGDVIERYGEMVNLKLLFPRKKDLMKQRKTVLKYIAGTLAVNWQNKNKSEISSAIAAKIY